MRRTMNLLEWSSICSQISLVNSLKFFTHDNGDKDGDGDNQFNLHTFHDVTDNMLIFVFN